MQIYSHLIWLLLAFTIVLIHARNVHYDFNDQLDDDDYNVNARKRQMLHVNRNIHRSSIFDKDLSDLFKNEENILNAQERSLASARKVKAIVKGDPREFMG
ncbi:unnamed protein product [Rotaria sordida]|uniref:Uncharacterized protein n=1 Tax=Rotaria sordida TaxID=392033 RepID=A0A813XX43_9BILA|nr:unnamed protein product [Rotaria sordida]CAF0845622.1 unnamed protein product [Rotaria sordida]CAF0876978.1 unnamed protein product [Rotaria sordida]CAF0989037.1 unnamed protein product [Rotaria sordida]CAF1062905.1 unnamed protein product [Rotaria sordida]